MQPHDRTARRKRASRILGASAAAAVIAAWAVAPAAAQEAPADLSLSDLMNIKLQTGSFLELDLAKSPLSMTIIDKDKIRYSGARHMTELLEIYVPGFQYMYNKWNGEIWGMRGIANDRNTKFIYLVNGHKMNHESRDGLIAEISLGLLGDVERVEVLRGPAGLVYGSGAIAGIVNVVTRKAEGNKTEVAGQLGTWSSLEQTSEQAEVFMTRTWEGDQSLALSLGYRQSEGVGQGETRLYGKPHWPYRAWDASGRGNEKSTPQGVPVDGSAWSTPGNWKVGLDYQKGAFRLYARATHQVENAGGLFPLDPWPDIAGAGDTSAVWVSGTGVDTGAPTRMVDGRPYTAGTAPLDEESWATNRRQYVIDNIMADATYTLPIDVDELKLRLGFDGATNRIQREKRAGYESAYVEERGNFADETFGERRYTAGATYLLKRVDKLQLAAGYEFRMDDIGDDLTGKNSQAEKATHPIVSDVTYYNNAFFSEGFYDVTEQVGVHLGARYDVHTRTIDHGGVFSPKAALIYQPAQGHSIKAIFQGSANNGNADNYEYNRNNYNDEGKPYDGYHYEKPYERPGGNSVPIAGVSETDLHKLKPEKSYSAELTSTHDLGFGVSMSPSVSYNWIQDLFAWDQNLFRIVNVGQYEYINVDFDASYTGSKLSLGFNHTWQAPVNTDVEGQARISPQHGFVPDSTWDATVSKWKYTPKDTGVVIGADGKPVQAVINPVKSQVTLDGDHFLSLNDHISKVYLDYKIVPGVMLHTDARIFWGLLGRESFVQEDQAKGYNYWNIDQDAMVKWNASLHWDLPEGLKVSAYVYDILGSDNGSATDNGLATHTLRWQQMGESSHRDLFATDVRSYAVRVEKSF